MGVDNDNVGVMMTYHNDVKWLQSCYISEIKFTYIFNILMINNVL